MTTISPEDEEGIDFLAPYRNCINRHLEYVLAGHSDEHSDLARAMHYSTLLGGKRIRPVLSLLSAECFGIESSRALGPACAVEFIHAYSLIHDDLPAMDDDDLRRGQPTCHRAFDEATAILAGDALQTLAFELLSDGNEDISNSNQLRMISALSRASGACGMVYGQSLDLAAAGKTIDTRALEHIHEHKTGALIEVSLLLGALATHKELSPENEQSLRSYGKAIGLAFQIRDDILDVTVDTNTLGKRQGADEAHNKATYPALLGLDGARSKLDAVHQEAIQALHKLNGDTGKLRRIADYIVQRRY